MLKKLIILVLITALPCFGQLSRGQQFFNNLPTYETERTMLRALCLEDVNDIYAMSSDPEVIKLTGMLPCAFCRGDTLPVI